MQAMLTGVLLLLAAFAAHARHITVHDGAAVSRRSLLQANTTDAHELLAIDTSALPRMSNAYLEFVGDTSDVDNSRESSNVVAFYRPKTGLWFGHTAMPYSADGAVSPNVPNIFFVTSPPDKINSNAPPVKPPVAWKRVWLANRCSLFNRGKILSLWCPQADDGYVALGCVYKASGCAGWLTSHADPPSGAEVWGLVTLRADLAAPGQVPSVPLWANKGSGTQIRGIFFTTDITTQDAGSVWSISPTTQNGYSAGAVWASDSAGPPTQSVWAIDGSKVPKVPVSDLSNAQASCQYLTQQVSDFAPILKFDSSDSSLPTSLDTYLPLVQVAWGVDATTASQYPECRGCLLGGNSRLHLGQGQPGTLNTSSLRDYASPDCPQCPAELGEYLAFDGANPSKVAPSQSAGQGANISAPVYVFVVQKAGSMYDLWYQVFYASTGAESGNGGSAVADWEAVVVRLMLVAGQPHVVSVGASQGGSIVLLPDVQWQGRHPVLYVAPSLGMYSRADNGDAPRSTSSSSSSSGTTTVVLSPAWVVDGQQESHDGQGPTWRMVSAGGAQVHFLDDGQCPADVGGNMSWWGAYKGRYGSGSQRQGACDSLLHPWLADGNCQGGRAAAAPSTRWPELNWQVNSTTFPIAW